MIGSYGNNAPRHGDKWIPLHIQGLWAFYYKGQREALKLSYRSRSSPVVVAVIGNIDSKVGDMVLFVNCA